MSDDDQTCGARKDDGGNCGTYFGLCSECGRCFAHCEHREDRMARARSRGGYAATKGSGTLPPGEVPPPPETLEDAVLWAAWASHAVATGELGTTRANAAARLLKEFRQALERHESAEKLEEIRRRVEELGDDGDAPDLEALS